MQHPCQRHLPRPSVRSAPGDDRMLSAGNTRPGERGKQTTPDGTAFMAKPRKNRARTLIDEAYTPRRAAMMPVIGTVIGPWLTSVKTCRSERNTPPSMLGSALMTIQCSVA